MSGEIRFGMIEPENVLIIRFIGDLSGDSIFSAARAFFAENPTTINYPQIWDCRAWVGRIYDDEIAVHFKWNTAFRIQHGFPTANLQPIVLLLSGLADATAVATQFGIFRNRAIPTVRSEADAWQVVAPGTRAPPAARKFLGNGWTRFLTMRPRAASAYRSAVFSA